jgi:hypothetical protein
MTRTWTLADEKGRTARVTLAEYCDAIERAARANAAKPRLYCLESPPPFAVKGPRP